MTEEELLQHAENFLATVAKSFDLPELSFADGICVLDLGSGNVITLYPQMEGLHSIILYMPVGVIPLDAPKTPELQTEMLNGNDAWSLTQGATIGVDKKTGVVSLWQRFALPAESEGEIVDTIEVLAATAEYWRSIISEYGGEPAYRATGEGNPRSVREEPSSIVGRLA